MYLNELRVYCPRNAPPRIQRTGLGSINNFSSKTPPRQYIRHDGVTKTYKKPNKYGKVYRAVMGPFKFLYFMMETSSIHGFNHLTTKNRHYLEYILWQAAMIAGLYGFIKISHSTLSRYQNNPTVIALDKNWKEWNSTLPAATICPDTKYDEDEVEEIIANRFKKFDEDDRELALKFLDELAKANYSTFQLLPEFKAINPNDYLDSVVDIRYIMDFIVSNSNIDNDELNQHDLVLNVNEMSVCYSYNSKVAIYLNPFRWKTENYTHPSTKFLIVGSPLDGDLFTQVMGMRTGYTVYLHSSEEVPDIAFKGSSAPPDSYKTQDVLVLSIVSEPEIKYLSIPQRKCRFLEESNLEISKVYTYNLCRMNCRMKLGYSLCGCVPYFYKPSGNRKICNVEGMRCLSNYSNLLIKLVDGEKPIDCKCLPTCDDVIYVVENENNMDWPLGTNLKWGVVKYPHHRLKRQLIFGMADVLVNMGGTAGLFFGCSVLSLIEIFYFLTLRLLWFTVKKT